MAAFGIYADSELRDSARRGSLDESTGLLHAARPGCATTLCGLELDQLHEFGSHYRLELFPTEKRCAACATAAPQPATSPPTG